MLFPLPLHESSGPVHEMSVGYSCTSGHLTSPLGKKSEDLVTRVHSETCAFYESFAARGQHFSTVPLLLYFLPRLGNWFSFKYSLVFLPQRVSTGFWVGFLL